MAVVRRVAGMAVVVIAGFGGVAAAQSYGVGDQVLTIGAPMFRGWTGPGFINPTDGYLYVNNANNAGFSAPVNLPDGARITQICLYARNEDAVDVVGAGLQAVKLVPGGFTSGVVSIPGAFVTADFHFGYGVVCTGPLSYTFHDTADVDNDQVVENVAHRINLLFNNSANPLVGVGGVRIVWHRQVSPPPATATFPDVPTNHLFFQYVEALYAAGITAGYGNGNYGVNDPISRGQMAVFLAKALGLHWPL